MGAQWVQKSAKAETVQDAFNALYDDAEYEHGHDRYNGTISTCSLGRCAMRFSEATKEDRKKAFAYIDKCQDEDRVEKWMVEYIDLGVVEYKVITAKKVHHTKNEPIIRTKFVVRGYDPKTEKEYMKPFDTKKEADDHALALAVKNNVSYYTSKEGVLVKGNSTVCTIELESKSFKSKPKLKPMPNRRIVEIHEYIFFGLAGS